MATGVGAAAISLFVNMGVTGRSIAMIAFLTTCALSISTGTSWGTFAACIPIFIWLCDVVGGNPAMVMAALHGRFGLWRQYGPDLRHHHSQLRSERRESG